MISEFRGNTMLAGLKIDSLPNPAEMLLPLQRLQEEIQNLDAQKLESLVEMCAGHDRIMRLTRERVVNDTDFTPRCVWAAPVGLSLQEESAIDIGTAMAKMFLRFSEPFAVGYFDQTRLMNVDPVERVLPSTSDMKVVNEYPHGCYEALFIPGYMPIATLRMTIFFPEAWWDAAILLKGHKYEIADIQTTELCAVCHQSRGGQHLNEPDITPQFIDRTYRATISSDKDSCKWNETERLAWPLAGDSGDAGYVEEVTQLSSALKHDDDYPVSTSEVDVLTGRLIEVCGELSGNEDGWRKLSIGMGRFFTKLWQHAPFGHSAQ